jgi:hypothetical protein
MDLDPKHRSWNEGREASANACDCKSPSFLDIDITGAVFLAPPGRAEREGALDWAFRYGSMINKARGTAYRLSRQLRHAERFSKLDSVKETIGVALQLFAYASALAGVESRTPVLATAVAWKSDENALRLAPCFILAAEFIREHEAMHGTSARALDSFDCSAAANRILFAIASTMNDVEKGLLHELLSLCVRATLAHPPGRSDAETEACG